MTKLSAPRHLLVHKSSAKHKQRDERGSISRKSAQRYLPFIHVTVYALLVLFVTIVLLWRYPNNIAHPNFYAEDGSVFYQNVLAQGWLHALFTPFNGYFVFGMYGVEWIAWVLNFIFGHQGLLSLPQYFAFASILFMAAVIALPYLLIRKTFGVVPILLVILFSALMPLPTSPHVVIGTVGNQKWIFLYLALLLTMYRLFNSGKLGIVKSAGIDIVILICAYTNATTYLLLPILYLPYLRTLWNNRKRPAFWQTLRKLAHQSEVISLLALSVFVLPQVAYVALHGIPAIPGYLDSPYQFSKTIEIFLNRTFLFGVTHLFNGHMNNALAAFLTLVLFAVGWFWLKGKEKVAFWVSVYAAVMASLLFVANRPGVSDFFFNYRPSGSGPDQFFYAQTLVMYLPIVLASFAVARRIPARWLKASLLSLFVLVVVVSALVSNTWYGARWRNASVFENYANTFIDQALVACGTQNSPTVNVVLYPYADGQFLLKAPRKQICTPRLTRNYQLSYQELHLQPNNNDFEAITRDRQFFQTFKANENDLNGIRIFLSDFGNYRRIGTYVLNVYDSSCKTLVRQTTIPKVLLDNTYYDARFKPIRDSDAQTYCFNLSPPKTSGFSPLAIQKSSPDVYRAGQLIEHGTILSTDVVFQPLYTQTKL